jgi:outer membrane receptor for ferric coprogen and ferric-rhodotorulic acid
LTYANRIPLPIESFEQAELLKGLTAFMSGFEAPGELVNHVLKRPTDVELASTS